NVEGYVSCLAHYPSETRSQPELERARIADGGDLSERRRRRCRIRARAEVAVQRHDVRAVGEVEAFDERVDPDARAQVEPAAEPRAQREEIGSLASIALDERAVDDRPPS